MLGRFLGVVAIVTAVVGGGLASCGGGEDGDGVPTIDCSTATPVSYTALKIIPKCENCHSSKRTDLDDGDKDTTSGASRHGATEGYDYDTYEGTAQQALTAQDDIAGVGANDMPPDDHVVDGGGKPPSITEEEKTEFYTWVQCGQPQ